MSNEVWHCATKLQPISGRLQTVHFHFLALPSTFSTWWRSEDDTITSRRCRSHRGLPPQSWCCNLELNDLREGRLPRKAAVSLPDRKALRFSHCISLGAADLERLVRNLLDGKTVDLISLIGLHVKLIAWSNLDDKNENVQTFMTPKCPNVYF